MIPFISIIVPVYNGEKYLYKFLESIRDQTFNNIEVIVVDDGPTDSSGEICDQFAIKDKRLKVIHDKNCELVEVCKKALTYCRSEYIGFTDSDDWIDLALEITGHSGWSEEKL